MERVSDENLHLLFDEPIYVIPDHGDHPIIEDEAEEYVSPPYVGNNKKGICVFIGDQQDSYEQDLEFLFKGLNALDITKSDIALFNDHLAQLTNYPEHTIRIEFNTSISEEIAFSVSEDSGVSCLHARPITEIRNSLELKKKFWLSLKELFGKA